MFDDEIEGIEQDEEIIIDLENDDDCDGTADHMGTPIETMAIALD